MNKQVYAALVYLTQYRTLFMFLLLVLLAAFAIILMIEMVKKIFTLMDAKENSLKSKSISEMDRNEKGLYLRKMLAPDGVDPCTNSYTTINDGGKEIYAISLTAAVLPKKTTFATTFSPLLNFDGVESSIFIKHISDGKMTRTLEHHIDVLETEKIRDEGDPNRVRRLTRQTMEAEKMADQIDGGSDTYYWVGFLFTLYADNLEKLIKKCDEFRSLAVGDGIEVIGCFGLQAEAYLSNAPYNQVVKTPHMTGSSTSGIVMHRFNKRALSTIYNFTQCDFSHRNGIPIGRNISTGHVCLYDIYDPSHDGFTIVIAGKTNSGKSTLMKICIARYALLGYRFVAVDSQARKGMNEGEYTQVAVLINGVNFQISNGDFNREGFNILNPFEVSESSVGKREGLSTIYTTRTLDLADKCIQVKNDIMTMILGDKDSTPSFETLSFIEEIVSDNVKACYADLGIIDKDPDSLYVYGVGNESERLTSGKIKKDLPTITQFYKRVLRANHRNKDRDKILAYKTILSNVKEYIRELYYVDVPNQGVIFLTKEEYMNLSVREDLGAQIRVYSTEGKLYEAIEIHGTRAYYDGQTTIHVDKDCPFVNIDISQLTESEKVVARTIALNYLVENYVKRNSEDLKSADKLLCILDEAHEEFKYKYSRAVIDNGVRTSRKRNVGFVLLSQLLREYDYYEETRAILANAAAKFVFRQEPQDREILKKFLNITDAQVDRILSQGQESKNNNPRINSNDVNLEGSTNKHRGEVCVVDGGKVAFLKIDYLYNYEKYAVETDARVMNDIYEVKVG